MGLDSDRIEFERLWIVLASVRNPRRGEYVGEGIGVEVPPYWTVGPLSSSARNCCCPATTVLRYANH